MKKISNLEKKDFANHLSIKVIIDELAKPKTEQDGFNLIYSMKEFIKFIRDRVKGGFSIQYRQWGLIKMLLWDWEDLDSETQNAWNSESEYNSDDAFEDYLDHVATELDVLMLFEKIRDACHNSGFFLEHIYPNAKKGFFDKLSE